MRGSLVIQVLNEGRLLTQNTDTLRNYLEDILEEYEIILVENGSSDNTLEEAVKLSRKWPQIRIISIPEPCLGEALRRGISDAYYENIVYYPIDLSVNLDFIPKSIKLLEVNDIVIGSKRLRDAIDHRAANRRLMSKGYHGAVRLLFNTDLTDTTCVKAYRRKAALELMNQIPSSSSVFETEVLLEAKRRELEIAQIPVNVDDTRRGRLPLGYKVVSKGRDLASLRLDVFSLLGGGVMFLVGSVWMGFLSVEKLVFNHEGFLNPYSFLISMILILFGAQGIAYGLFARLFLQLRQEITAQNSRFTGNVFKEEEK